MGPDQFFAQLNGFLAGGKLNDSFVFAAQHMPFSPDNAHFLRLLARSLDVLGFPEEGMRVAARVADAGVGRTSPGGFFDGDANDVPPSFAPLHDLLETDCFNEGFSLAAQRTPFWLENPDFLRFFGHALHRLGFVEEGQSVSAFAVSLVAHRGRFSGKTKGEHQRYAELGHSHPYAQDGQHEQWTHPVWDRRARMIAGRIPEGATVLDLGCGNMLIERYLPASVRYLPCDVARRDDRTLVHDFDARSFPPDQGETHVVCLGVMPYLTHQEALLQHIVDRRKAFLVTFKPNEFIQAKVAAGTFPPAITLGGAHRIATEAGYEPGFAFVLGQGDEVLISGARQDHTGHRS